MARLGGDIEDATLSIEELHLKYGVETINVRLHRLTQKAWANIETIDNFTNWAM